ncbi:TatD family hydrolase [Pendulispora brunnea]|uniref:TatD family hydrolase n=1 Tax=Pendulispora brunnea TaxID=2905690 RepID=A0ABZ2JZP5_9BACT
MIDIGANLANKAFRGDLEAVLRRARLAGVTTIVATGTSESVSRAALEIARDNGASADGPRVFATAGIHPHHAKDFSRGSLDTLRTLAGSPEVRAIGECGLDFDRNFSPRDAQLRCFEAQLELAADLGMPVFLHERAAEDDFSAVLARFRPRLTRAVVHCFTGSAETLARYLDLDLHIGITGWICDERRGTHLVDLVRRIPRDRIMIETDAPYILPRSMPRAERPRTGRNEPCFLRWVLEAVAKARNESETEFERATVATTKAFFDLPADDVKPH